MDEDQERELDALLRRKSTCGAWYELAEAVRALGREMLAVIRSDMGRASRWMDKVRRRFR